MKLQKCLATLLGLVLLVGCASMEDLTAKQDAKNSCCKSPADFRYEQLLPDAPLTLLLNEESPVFGFSTGKSYFKALALPSPRMATKLRVRSHATGSTAFETRKLSQLYCPQVTYLSASYETLASSDIVPTVARGALATGIFPSFIAEFEIPPTAAYAILHTNPASYGKLAVRYTGGGAFMVGSALVIDRGGESIVHPCGPIANAEVTLL